MKQICLFTHLFICAVAFGQEIEKAFQHDDFEKVILLEKQTNETSVDECYMMGFAFYALDNNKKAVYWLNKSVKTGNAGEHVYFYLAIAQRNENDLKQAFSNFRTAIRMNPKSQMNVTELARTYYLNKQTDSAIYYLRSAREMEFESSNPYFFVPELYAMNNDYEAALREYDISIDLLKDQDSATTAELIMGKGAIYYLNIPDKSRLIAHYEAAAERYPKTWEFQEKLIKSYMIAGERTKAITLLNELRSGYRNGTLSPALMEKGMVNIHESTWENRILVYRAYLKPAEETLDFTYMALLLDENGEKIDFRIMTEKTIQLSENSAKHLLCSRETDGTHHTYPYGWSSDDIPFDEFEKAVVLVLDGKIGAGASSKGATVYSGDTPSKKGKRKKGKK